MFQLDSETWLKPACAERRICVWQHPRKAFLEQVCGVFAQSGRAVPVFNDKHLAPDWADSLWMVARCRELGAPFMAGSSIPLNWRRPWLEHPAGADLREAVVIGFSGLDIYGAHACDALQVLFLHSISHARLSLSAAASER